MGHPLPGAQRLLHQKHAIGHVVPKTVVFSRVDPDHKARVQRRDPHQLLDYRPQLQDVVDLFSQNIAAGHIGISGDGFEYLQVFRQVISGRDRVLDDGQRHPADPGQKSDQHSGFPVDGGHDGVDLPQHLHRFFFLHQRGVGDLHIFDPVPGIGTGDPQKLVLEQCVVPILRRFPVGQDPGTVAQHVRLRDLFQTVEHDGILRGNPLGKHIAVEIDLFQIRKDSLPVLGDGEGVADPVDIPGGLREIPQDEIRKVQKRIVVDPAIQVFPCKAGIGKLLCRYGPLRLQRGLLFLA